MTTVNRVRKRLGVSIEQFAKDTGFSVSYIAKVLYRSRHISLGLAKAIVAAYPSVTYEELLNGQIDS